MGEGTEPAKEGRAARIERGTTVDYSLLSCCIFTHGTCKGGPCCEDGGRGDDAEGRKLRLEALPTGGARQSDFTQSRPLVVAYGALPAKDGRAARMEGGTTMRRAGSFASSRPSRDLSKYSPYHTCGRLVFEAHRLLYHTTLGLRVIKICSRGTPPREVMILSQAVVCTQQNGTTIRRAGSFASSRPSRDLSKYSPYHTCESHTSMSMAG